MPSKRQVGIAGMGYYVPERKMTNFEFEKFLATSDEWIQTRTGIKERRISDPSQAASDLGYEAAKQALADAKIGPEAIDMIIVATASPDMVFPATACLIQNSLGAINAGAFDLSAVCSGFLYAYITGAKLIESGQANYVLVIATEKFSSLLDWQDRTTCVLMGDGAGAVVLSANATQGVLQASVLGADGTGVEKLLIPAGGSARPTSHATIDQRLHYMKMNGQEIYKFGVHIIGDVVTDALAKAGLAESELDLLIPHQANIRIIQSAAKRINLPMDKVVVNIDRYSNTSAASVPIAMVEARNSRRLKTGMNVALVAFGAGLTWGAAVLRW